MLCDACSLASVLAAFHLHLPSAGTDLLTTRETRSPPWPGVGDWPGSLRKAPAAPGRCTALPLGARLGSSVLAKSNMWWDMLQTRGSPSFL